jgi:hypothetical protein
VNIVYNKWDHIQKMKFTYFGINKYSTFIENRNIENDVKMISSIFSIKFPLQSNFSKSLNSAISAIILILCVNIFFIKFKLFNYIFRVYLLFLLV